MARPSLRDLSLSQWFYIVAPTFAGAVVAWFARHELPFPEPLYFAGGGLGLSLVLGFLILYGDQL